MVNRFYRFLLSFFIVFSLNGLVLSKQLPVYLRDLRCPRTDFDACFVTNGNKAIPLIVNGDPEYGIPSMVPLKLPFVSFVSTPTLSVNLTNVEVHGLDKMKITNHTTDMEKGLFTVYLKGENVTIVGDYTADGRILIMPLNGKGRFSIYLKNGQYKSVNSVKIILKNGVEYFKMLDSRFNAKFERIVFNLDNLFQGNKQLGDQVNAFLNENWETLVEDFGPSIGNTISQIINGIFESFAAVVTVKESFI